MNFSFHRKKTKVAWPRTLPQVGIGVGPRPCPQASRAAIPGEMTDCLSHFSVMGPWGHSDHRPLIPQGSKEG